MAEELEKVSVNTKRSVTSIVPISVIDAVFFGHVTTDVTNQPRGHARYRLCPECHMTGYLSKAHQSVRLGPTVRRIKRANIPERPAD